MKQANEPKRVPISERALIARINRKLRHQTNPEQLRRAHSARQREELGDFYTFDAATYGEPKTAFSSGVGLSHVNLEVFGRKLGVLKPWETVE